MDDEETPISAYYRKPSQLTTSAVSSEAFSALCDGSIPHEEGYGTIHIPQYIIVDSSCDDNPNNHNFCIRFAVVSALLFLGVATFRSSLPTNQTNSIDAQLFGSQQQQHHLFQKIEEYQRPLYFDDQLVDHFAEDTTTWRNRYYVSSKYFQGPGSPLIVVVGGEGAVDEVFYPFVREDLAKQFGAFVLQTEHRFYGTSVPTEAGDTSLPTNEELKTLLSPDQALKDNVRLIRHVQGELGCSIDRTEPNYCPVLTVGASYPGFLSAMMRFVHPDVVDMSYASSAPIKMYGRQTNDQNLYFDHVTHVAEQASPGCAEAYKSTLTEAYEELKHMPIDKAAKKLKICEDRLPSYIDSSELFAYELTNLVGITNADFNMEYHPPGDPSTDLIRSCKAFQQTGKTPMERLADFYALKVETAEAPNAKYMKCYDLHWDLPPGPNARITGSDLTGLGYGFAANSWEYQCCVDLVVTAGFSNNSMFLELPFDMDRLAKHCQARFEVDPAPYRMVSNWHFDDLVGQGGSYILFTNGDNDAWSRVSQRESLSDTIVALTFPTGAHHSELNTVGTNQKECDDIIEGRKTIAEILGQWIGDVKLQAVDA